MANLLAESANAASAHAVSLNRYLIGREAANPSLGTPFCHLMMQLASAAKIMARAVAGAGLIGSSELAGGQNASGDAKKILDVLTNDTVVAVFAGTGLVSEITSEEMERPHQVPGGAGARFILCVDPLDGSSNTEANGAAGTIFAVYRRQEGQLESGGLRGSDQVAAGYVMYGPSTILVYTSSGAVNGFTLDPDIGEFLLSHPEMQCPRRGSYFSANMANLSNWPAGVQRYAKDSIEGKDGKGGRRSLRYTGAFVADFHRILISGGIFLYPQDTKNPSGKLRLLYECAPLALLIEHAGGLASDGQQRILDIEASEIHQRTPIAIGSAEDVAAYESYLK